MDYIFFHTYSLQPLCGLRLLSILCRTMKFTILDSDEDEYVPFEKFTKKKHNPKPMHSHRAMSQHINEDGDTRYDESGLQELYEQGHINEVVRMIRRGKEATVYVCRNEQQQLLAAKVYTDMTVRSFRNDTVYRDNRFIGSKRLEKAVQQHTKTGVDAQQALWIYEEFRQLHYFYSHNIAVPKPIAYSGRVILMEFIGDESGEAPRLSDCDISPAIARDAFQQSMELLQNIVALGRIHGDFSTYNILWWQSHCIAIDFPQVIEIQRSPHARELLRRDIHSLCHSFARLGVHSNEEIIFKKIEHYADWRK